MARSTDLSKMTPSLSPMDGANMTKFEAGVFSSLLTACTISSMTSERRMEEQAQEDQRRAFLMLDDARRQEAMADEDRRKAYFASQGPTY